MIEENKPNHTADIEAFGNEIVSLLDQAINDDNIIFNNPHLIACWEKKDCKKDACFLHNQKKNCVAGKFPALIVEERFRGNLPKNIKIACNAMFTKPPVRQLSKKLGKG